MIHRRFRSSVTVAAALALTGIVGHADQARRQAPARAQVPIQISLKGAEPFEATGQGSCTHAPKAAIYGVISEMWSVNYREDGRDLQLTLWKPADGSESMFNLSVNGAKSVSVSTVRGGSVSGTGTVTLAPAAKGGTFTINATPRGKAAGPVTGTIKCDAFTPHIAEGGN